MASATKDAAQTDHLIAQLDDYMAHGVNAVTVFFHHSPWCQGPTAMRYDLGGDGTEKEPGIRWHLEYVSRHAKTR
ncbi:MAG: hypothetical protein HY735_14820 [Verrucomicrobia bacterium]|nr:hypothetical protein [Verrucomicrobiota bacterium]